MTKRFERIHRSRIRLTDRDFKTVVAVFEARYMTNRMIARLFYKPTTFSWCKQRVRYLFDLGYLKKRKAHVNEPDIYFVGLKGRRHIASLGEYPQELVDKIAGVSGGRAEAPLLMMNHDLTLSRLYVNARVACKQFSWAMRWKNARLLELEELGVQPDAWIEVTNRDKTKQSFIEFTAVVPTKSELSDRIGRYEEYWERTKTPVPVLWLTTSQSKLNQLRRGVLAATYKDYFLLGLIENVGRFLTGPIWRWSESEEMVSWLNAPNSCT